MSEIKWEDLFPEVASRRAKEVVEETTRLLGLNSERKQFLNNDIKAKHGSEFAERERLVESLSRTKGDLALAERRLLDPEEGLVSQEKNFLEKVAKLERSIEFNHKALSAYDLLVQCYNSSNQFDHFFKNGELIKCSRSLVMLKDSLEKLFALLGYSEAIPKAQKITIIEIFYEKSMSNRKMIEKKLEALFNDALAFDQRTLRISSKVKAGQGYEATLAEILVCLLGLGLLSTSASSFSAKLVSFFELNIGIDKKVSPNFILEVKTSEDSGVYSVDILKKPLSDAEIISQLFSSQKLLASTVKSIGIVLEIVKLRTENPRVNLIEHIKKPFMEAFVSAARDKIILPLLPSETSKFGSFFDAYKSLSTKLDQMLSIIGFVSQGEIPLGNLCVDLKDKFVERLSLNIVDDARSLILSSNSEIYEIDETFATGRDLKEAPNFVNLSISTESFFAFPSCKVSLSAVKFLDCVKKCLKEIDKTSLSLEASLSLYRTARSLFDLYLASYEVAHKEVTEQLPGAVALFYTDLIFLSRQCLLLPQEFRERFPHPLDEFASFVDFSDLFHSKADSIWREHLEFQKKVLAESFEIMAGLADTDQSKRHGRVEQALKQILHKLGKISAGWKPILPEVVYVRQISLLIDFICKYLISEMLKLSDIGATECDALSDLLKVVFKAESFLQLPNHSYPISQFAPSWNKFKTIVGLLTTSLTDIGSQVKVGKLSALEPEEIAFFINALFTDSELRRSVLASASRIS